MTLSDYKNVMRIDGKAVLVYPEKNVKEFIKEILKMNISKRHDKLIRELAGKELCVKEILDE